MRYFSVYVVLVLFLLSEAKPDEACKTGCIKSENDIFKYVAGKAYEYSIDSTIAVALKSTNTENGGINLRVNGNAKVFAEGNCAYTLQLSDVRITSTSADTHIDKKIKANIQTPVQFTFANGNIGAEICSEANDDIYALNIKRSIISLLQSDSNEEQVSTIDVFGQCSTQTKVSQRGEEKIITKLRNLNSCAYKGRVAGGIINGVIDEKSHLFSPNLLKGDYKKEVTIRNGIISKVKLTEDYVFGNTGDNLNTNAKVETTLISTNGGISATAPASGSKRISITFENTDTYATKNIAALTSALTDIVQSTGDYIKKNSAEKIINLIRLMRNANAETLIELATLPNPNKRLSRKVYLDALFRTGTAESTKAILKQLNKFESTEKALAILSLNWVDNVDKETIKQAITVLNANSPKEIFLVIGSLVSKYCSRFGCDSSDIEEISKKFADNMKHCKSNNRKVEERIIYILKGVGNTHNIATNLADSLVECSSTGHSNRIRVAALQAFTVASCNPLLQRKAIELLRDRNEDSEIRIEAYLAAVTCPSAQLSNDISNVINSETVYQVGGFITSHLQVIRDSTDASREKQRYYLGNIRVTKKFPKNIRRYSANSEISYDFESLGIGASADHKLIYSQNGFLPRSLRLNATAKMYGTNFNIFEASIRQENIENILEYYFGPKGLANRDFDEVMHQIGVNPRSHSIRERRSIADESTKFAKKYKSYGSPKYTADLNVDLSLKLFGSEMFFLSLGDNIPNSLDEIIDTVSSTFEQLKNNMTSFDKEFIAHSLFLDMKYMYPTGIGMPLELSVQGFAANKINFGVALDIDAILAQNWLHSKYRLKVIPSIDINLEAQFNFNAYVISAGLRGSSSLHSATGSDIRFELINDGFNLEVELPRNKMELVNVKINSEYFTYECDKKEKTFLPIENKIKKKAEPFDICFNELNSIGINMCIVATNLENISKTSDLSTKNLNLFQPIGLNIYVTSEQKIKLTGTHTHTKAGNQKWKLEFSTPGSKESHDTSLAFELASNPRNYVRAVLQNREYQLALETGINKDNKEVVLYGQFEQNGQKLLSKIGFLKNGNEYRPLIQLQDNNEVVHHIKGYHANGKILVQQTNEIESRYTFENFQILNKENERIMLNGWTNLGAKSLKSDLKLSVGVQSYLIKNEINVENSDYKFSLFVNDEKSPENVLGILAHVRVGEQLFNIHLNGRALSWEFDTRNDIRYIIQSDTNTLTSSEFSNHIWIKHKEHMIGTFNLNGSHDGFKKLVIKAEATKNNNIVSLSINYNENEQSPSGYLLEINGKLNKEFVEIVLKTDFITNQYLIDYMVKSSVGSSLTAKGKLGQHFTLQDILIDMQGSIQLTGKNKPNHWVILVRGSVDKTSGEFKLSRENVELVQLNSELQHPQEKLSSGKLNLAIKNVMTFKADLKVAKNGKGEVQAVIETPKTEMKHKLEIKSKFHVQGPKYDVEAVFNFDEKKIFSLKTENLLEKYNLVSKNELDILNKIIYFEANGSIKGEWRSNGEVHGKFLLKLPDGREIDVHVKRNINTNPKSYGNFTLNLNEILPNKKGKRSLETIVKFDQHNINSKEFSESIKVVFSNTDSKKFDITGDFKSNSNSVKSGFKVQTDYLRSDVVCMFNINDHPKNQTDFKLVGNYGQNSINVNGGYQISNSGNPTSLQLNIDLEMPDTALKNFQLKTTAKLLNFDVENSGVSSLELHFEEILNKNQFMKVNTLLRKSSQKSDLSLNVESDQLAGPLIVKVTFTSELQSANKHTFSVDFNYNSNFLKSSTDLSFNTNKDASIVFIFDSSLNSYKNINIEIQTKRFDDGRELMLVANQNGDSYLFSIKMYDSGLKTGFEIQGKPPRGEPVFANVYYSTLDNKTKFTLQVNFFELDLNAHAETSFKEFENFYFVGQIDSKKLKLNNYDMDIRAQSKSITIIFKDSSGIILSGSVAYTIKKEKTKISIDGQGTLQYLKKTHVSGFKLIRQLHDVGNDKEIGVSYIFNGHLGPKNILSTLKFTNKEHNAKLSVCEEKKQCTNVQLQSLLTEEEDLNNVEQSFLILFDLRELGYPYELELQSKAVKRGLKFGYTLDFSIASNRNLKYKINFDIKPKNTKFLVVLPSREVYFEAMQDIPSNGNIFGHYENRISLHLDRKNKPEEVTSLITKADVNGDHKSIFKVQMEAKMEHPAVRPLIISGNLDVNNQKQHLITEILIDIFKKPEQKIIASSQIHNMEINHGFNITSKQLLRSNGFGWQFEFNGHTAVNAVRQEFTLGADVITSLSDSKASLHILGNPNHIEININALNSPIIDIVGDLKGQKLLSILNTKLRVFGNKPVETDLELSPTIVKLSIKREGLLDASANLKLGKELNFRIIGIEKNLLNGRIAFDVNNFLETTYESDETAIKEFLDNSEEIIKNDVLEERKKLRKHFDRLRHLSNKQVELFKNSSPDLSQLSKSYETSFNEIAKELENDPSIKDIAKIFRKLYSNFAKIVIDITNILTESSEKLQKSFMELMEKLEMIFSDTILPLWEEFLAVTSSIFGEIKTEILSFLLNTLKSTLQIVKENAPISKNFVKVVTEFLKPLTEGVQEVHTLIVEIAEKFLVESKDYMSKLPTFNDIEKEFREKLKEISISEKVMELINTIFGQLEILPKTPETVEFLQKAHNYIAAKLKNQMINEDKAVEELLKLFIKAMRSVLANVELSPFDDFIIPSGDLKGLFNSVTYYIDNFKQLLSLLTFRASVINFVLNESFVDIFNINNVKSLIYFNKFELHGHIFDDNNIITFDGHYYPISGTCKYILAQDSVNNNFTVIAQLNDGELKSIILTDKDGGFIEINNAGVLKLNNKNVEYPVHENNLHSWRLYYTVWVLSEYGVQVMCTIDLKMCHIMINGFYTSKVRGLLGNGNAEPNDDFIQHDGVIATDSSTFGNNYSLGKCAPMANSNQDITQQFEICNDIFSYNSPLALGYIFVDATPYRKACHFAVKSAPKKEMETVACIVAKVYGSSLKIYDKIILLPDRCLKCIGAPGQRELNQEFTVKIPNNKADLVFVVDLNVNPTIQKSLIAPAITKIRDSLKTRGLTDIQIGVIAYNDSQIYPAILTSNNGKLNYQGDISNVQLFGPKVFCWSCLFQVTFEQKIIDVYEQIEKFLKNITPHADEKAITMALQYPFRAGSAKSIVVVRSNTLEFSNVLKLLRAQFLDTVASFNTALFHLIGPVNDMSLDGISPEKIVGFSNRFVATLDGKDSKKRPKLEFKKDMGNNFVLNGNGWVFATQHFESLAPKDREKMLNQVINTISDSLFKTEIVSDCKCTSVYGLHAQHNCVVKSSNFIQNKKLKIA